MVDFSLVWDLKIQGAQQAEQNLNQVANAFARGEATAKQFSQALRDFERAQKDLSKPTQIQPVDPKQTELIRLQEQALQREFTQLEKVADARRRQIAEETASAAQLQSNRQILPDVLSANGTSIAAKVRSFNFQQAKAELDQVTAAFEKGEVSVDDMNLALSKYDRALSQATRTQRTITNEWKIAHPALSQFSRGIDIVSSSAFRLQSIYNSVNTALIRQNTSATKNAELLNQKAILERQLADIQTSPDYDPTKPSQKELDLKQQIAAVDSDIKQNGTDNFSQMADTLIMVGVNAPIAVKAVTDLIKKWGDLKGIVEAANTAAAGGAAASGAAGASSAGAGGGALGGVAAGTGAAGTGALGGALGAGETIGQLGSIFSWASIEGIIKKFAEDAGLIPKTAEAASDSDRYQILGPNAARDKLSGQIVPLWNTVQDNSKDVAKTTTNVVDTWYTVKTNSGDVAKSSGSVADSWYDVKNSTKETQKSTGDIGTSIIQAGQNIYGALVTAWDRIRSFTGGGGGSSSTPSSPSSGGNSSSPTPVTAPVDPWQAFLASHPGAIRLGEHAAKLPGGQITAFANGGTLLEPVVGVGQRTGQMYSFAENGPEEFLGSGSAARGGGTTVINNYYNQTIVQGSVVTEQKLAETVSREQSINYKRRFH